MPMLAMALAFPPLVKGGSGGVGRTPSTPRGFSPRERGRVRFHRLLTGACEGRVGATNNGPLAAARPEPTRSVERTFPRRSVGTRSGSRCPRPASHPPCPPPFTRGGKGECRAR